MVSFIGKKSLELTTHLLNSTENDLKFCKLKIIFQPPDSRNSLFRYKYSLKKKILSDIVYRYTCSTCKVTKSLSNLIGKRLNSVKQSAVSDHVLQCNSSIVHIFILIF